MFNRLRQAFSSDGDDTTFGMGYGEDLDAKTGRTVDLTLRRAMNHDIVVGASLFISKGVREPEWGLYDLSNQHLLPANSGQAAFLNLMRKPNPNTKFLPFISRVGAGTVILGRGYVCKLRNSRGVITSLWYVSRLNMLIIRDANGAPIKYRVTDRQSVFSSDRGFAFGSEISGKEFEPKDVIVFEFLPSDTDPLVSVSPLKSILPLLNIDARAVAYVNTLLERMGSGTVVSPDGDKPLYDIGGPSERVKIAMDRLRGLKTRIGLGETVFIPSKVKVDTVGFKPSDVLVSGVTNTPESRTGMIAGIPAVLLGLEIGLENSPFSHLPTARKFYAENTQLPLIKEIATTITEDILSEFTSIRNVKFWFNKDDLGALSEDIAERWRRYLAAWKGDGITRNTYLVGIGMDPIDESDGGEMYYSEWKSQYASKGLDKPPVEE